LKEAEMLLIQVIKLVFIEFIAFDFGGQQWVRNKIHAEIECRRGTCY
jgi:hypothetical protein